MLNTSSSLLVSRLPISTPLKSSFDFAKARNASGRFRRPSDWSNDKVKARSCAAGAQQDASRAQDYSPRLPERQLLGDGWSNHPLAVYQAAQANVDSFPELLLHINRTGVEHKRKTG